MLISRKVTKLLDMQVFILQEGGEYHHFLVLRTLKGTEDIQRFGVMRRVACEEGRVASGGFGG